jgi:mandelamide amidase
MGRKSLQLTNHTASELLERLNSGSISAVEVADEVINKIGETGNLGAIAAFDPNAYRVQAEASDRRRAREEAGCLDGIPLVLKDNINTADLPTTGGTGALVGMIPTKDAPAAAALRREGAILAAKAVMHELAFGITSNNSVTGPARNPYKPSMIPGGSSGGTAAAVSARQFPAGLGTDTGGSVRIPSALCGLIGFRPSVGRYAGEGVIPISNTRDTIGLIARSMADIRLLDGVMANRSASESKSRDVRSLRIGVPRTRLWENLEPGVEKLADDFMTRLAVEGVTFVEADFSEIWELNDNTGFPVALFEVMRNLPAYLEDAGYGVSFDDLLAGVGSPDVKGILSSQKGDEAMPEAAYRAAIEQHRPKMQQIYKDYFKNNRLDAVIFPTTPLTARPIGHDETVELNGNQEPTFPVFIRNTDVGSNIGAPGISLPMGLTSGLPAGIELEGLPDGDDSLLIVAASVSRYLNDIPPPTL